MTKHPNGYSGQDGKLYKRKSTLIVELARKLVAHGEKVTHSPIIGMLDKERPGHNTYPGEISRAIKGIDRSLRSRRGQTVEVDGKQYPSIRDAARANGISMQAARKRFGSSNFANRIKII